MSYVYEWGRVNAKENYSLILSILENKISIVDEIDVKVFLFDSMVAG